MTPVSSFKAFVRRSCSVLVLSALFTGASYAAPTLTVVGGKLTGATGVDVGGVLYNVEFKDGTCSALFSGCDSPTDFVFQSFGTALTASSALLDQVFLNVPGYNFDDDPALTMGCEWSGFCLAYTPYQVANGSALTIAALNFSAGPGVDQVGQGSAVIGSDTTTSSSVTWAVWSTATAVHDGTVPEPQSLALALTALAGLGVAHRRRRAA